MNDNTRRDLDAQVGIGGHAYVRNLAAAEAAVLRGQFNLARVLRALAHSQRAQALAAARLLAADHDPAAVLEPILTELADGPGPSGPGPSGPRIDPDSAAATVRAGRRYRGARPDQPAGAWRCEGERCRTGGAWVLWLRESGRG